MTHQYIVTYGEPHTGLNFCGPFDTEQSALEYAELLYDYYEGIPFPSIAPIYPPKSGVGGELKGKSGLKSTEDV